MTEWTMFCWQGPPEASMAALRSLGWHGPEEAPAEAADPRIGGFIPAAGTAPQTFDGIAYVAVAANAEIATPPGLAPAGPELFRALLGGF
ncbi:hypothetical protein [Falsiroseomonas tokyonensis]|uniref:Uncharacterized protein n=1 Tax=Falsiroseomonas tokyonensis TaxID=430521 RepID=A0ABV7BSZ7_9PROT|nr:hypothetical protein [Falsiroseomonas tokyonensis]MBU8538752.1 hypothetical protein [Falsiroseomonas tokyonensis]